MPNGTMNCFVDTNLLLYGRDLRFPEKRALAVEWIRHLSFERKLVISPQVMNEYGSVVLRKMRPSDLSELEADLLSMEPWCTAETSAQTTMLGLHSHRRYGFRFYDSVLLGSAVLNACDAFLTEDMSDGQRVEGVLLVNPFRHKPAELTNLVT